MKMLRMLAAVGMVVAGVLLLCVPSHASAPAVAPTRFTIVDAGTVGKPDVVLIPGLASSRAVWDAEAKLLAPNYRLHLVQINGFAGAPAGLNATGPILPGVVEELHQYIAQNKMHPAVIGHSLGGLVALMLADTYPTDVAKMIIVDSLPFYGAALFGPEATPDSIKPQADGIKAQLLAVPDDQFAAMQPMMVPTMVKNADAQKLVAASNVASDRKVFVNAMYEDMETDLRGRVAKIKTSTLLLYPFDRDFNKDEAKFMSIYTDAYRSMSNVKLVRIDDSRHFIMYDQPAKFDAAVEAFLK